MTQLTTIPCAYCGNGSSLTLEVKPGKARRNSRNQLVNDLPVTVAVCVDCHAGIMARRAEDAAARYRAMAESQHDAQCHLF